LAAGFGWVFVITVLFAVAVERKRWSFRSCSGRLGLIGVDTSAGLDVFLFQAISRDLVEIGAARRAILLSLDSSIAKVEVLGAGLVWVRVFPVRNSVADGRGIRRSFWSV